MLLMPMFLFACTPVHSILPVPSETLVHRYTTEEYEEQWGWLIAGMEVWVWSQHHGWVPGIVVHAGIPPGEHFESHGAMHGATSDRMPMQAFEDAWTIQFSIALNYNSMMVLPVRVLTRCTLGPDP